MSCAVLSLSIQSAYSQSINQRVIASAAGFATLTGGNTVSFTVGEAVITTAGSNPILTEGFNQPRFSLPGVPLPVQMNFTGTAERNYNSLDWVTFQESNNSYFELQRSVDGANFSKIATIATKAPYGTSTSKLTYNYDDNSFSSNKNYYRVKQVDINGKLFYSPVVMLQNVKTNAAFSVSPNPAVDKIQVTVPESGVISIIDLNGKIIHTLEVTSVSTLDIGNYSAGAYFINFKGETASGSLRFIKK
jgi:hypothetical protein